VAICSRPESTAAHHYWHRYAANQQLSFPIRLITWLSPKHASHGLAVWAPVVRAEERPLIYKRLDEALDLLKASAPGRYARVRHSLKGILIFGTDSTNASYIPGTGVCQLRERFMLAPDTTAAAVACTVVHEATHGRLFHLGIPYDEPLRYRVEMVCIKASLLTAQRLPGAEVQVERCRRQLTIDPEWFSSESFTQRAAGEMRKLGAPEWLIRHLVRVRRKRAAKVAGRLRAD
jgi:hypothetical protein